MQPSVKTVYRRGSYPNDAVKRVLLVEDDPDLSLLLVEYLEAYFYRVTTVLHGVDGLKAILDADFDVILCDLVMPNMPGDMFYCAVRRVKPHLCERFIFITANGENLRVKGFLNQMSSMILMKPFHLDDLLETILLLFRDLESSTHKLVPPDESLPMPLVLPSPELRSSLSS
jgi:DNA-binding response OmpR family regulator